MSNIQFPNKRLVQAATGNPLFISDIESLTENLINAIKIVLGRSGNGFYILSGFDYNLAANPDYTPGYFYYNGEIYYCSTGLNVGQSLNITTNDGYSKLHENSVSYPTYRLYEGVVVNSPVISIPAFSGYMTEYKYNLHRLKTDLTAAESNISTIQSDVSSLTTLVNSANYNIDNLENALGEEDLNGQILFKTIPIGAWNMVDDSTVLIPHNITVTAGNVLDRIIAAQCVVINDNGTIKSDLLSGGTYSITNTNISIGRYVDGVFNSGDYDSTAINRGYIIISYYKKTSNFIYS